MASVIETTALSIRKGDHDANLNFVGILGEVSYDGGYATDGNVLGTDINTTLRIHNAVTKGGIPLARADMRNITTELLAENRQYFDDKNLAYADLKNIEELEEQDDIIHVITIFEKYGFILDSTVKEYLESYALKDMTNVDTADLATDAGHSGKNLAYADTSNVNTADLVSSAIHNGTDGNKPLAYADGSNLDTTQLTTSPAIGPALARQDLTNVPQSFWDDLLINDYNFETKNNKDSVIPEDDAEVIAGHYPETNAVKHYVDSVIIEGSFLTRDMKNASSFEVLYAASGQQIYEYVNLPTYIQTPGTGFVEGDTYYSGIELDEVNNMIVTVKSIDNDGVPTDLDINIKEGTQNIQIDQNLYILSDFNTKCYVLLSSTLNTTSGLYEYSIAVNTSKTNQGQFEENRNYNFGNDSDPDFNGYSINSLLYVMPIEVDTNGEILNYNYIPHNSITNITDTSITINNGSGTPATIEFHQDKTLPDIGGAGLLKTNLTNLPGMRENDVTAEINSPWRIRHDEDIPDADEELTQDKYYNIATVAMVWNALHDDDNDLVHKTGAETITGAKTFTDYITGLGLRASAADLAERYESDKNYPIGTLIKFGGEKEITIADYEANGVISEKPAILLNDDEIGLPVALIGKTKIRVLGAVKKFNKLALSTAVNGVAIKAPEGSQVIAIALEDKDTTEEGLVYCVTKMSF